MMSNNEFGGLDAHDSAHAQVPSVECRVVSAGALRAEDAKSCFEPTAGRQVIPARVGPTTREAMGCPSTVIVYSSPASQHGWLTCEFSVVQRHLGVYACLQRRRHRQWRSRGS